jgi:hypothetical protein
MVTSWRRMEEGGEDRKELMKRGRKSIGKEKNEL